MLQLGRPLADRFPGTQAVEGAVVEGAVVGSTAPE